MNVSVTWASELEFSAIAESDVSIRLSPAGNGKGLRPMELVLLGLAGCTAMDVISILEKKRQDVTDFKVTADADRAEDHPRTFTKIRLHYIVTGRDVDPRAVERSIELSENKYCPAHAMLSKAAAIETSYEIVDAA